MKILEELENDRKALAEIGEVAVDEEETLEEPNVEESEEVVEEVKEEPKENIKPEVVEEEEDVKGPARLRYEKKQAEKRADELAAKVRELEALIKAPPQEAEEVEAPVVYPLLNKVIERVQYEEAGEEFTILEQKFREVAPPDFEDVSNQYKAALYNSIRVNNPDMTHEQLLKATNRDLLIKAGNYVRAGKDPIVEMYESAKRLGFKALPKEQPKEEVEVKEEPRPNLKKVAENKARNAGTAGVTSGAGQGGILTAAVLADMSVAEYSKIPIAERKRIMQGK